MAIANRSSNSKLSQTEAVLVDVVRLASRDDPGSIGRRVRRWLSSPAGRRGDVSDLLRSELLAALDPPDEHPRRLRRTVAAPRLEPEADVGPDSAAEKPVLEPHVEVVVERIAAEYARRGELADHGLGPTRTLLLSGPPGVGKTMTAAWLAARMGVPLVSIEPSGVMTSLLGESARNLVAALSEARQSPSVVLLDEIDAFGKSRDDALDVGELKRLVTTLLVELDRWPTGNLLVAATNHAGLLDHALARRFEVTLRMDVPGPDQRHQIVAAVLEAHGISVPARTLTALVELTEGRSGSELRTLALRGARTSVLTGEASEFTFLREALPADPAELSKDARAEFARAAHESGGLSQRQIGSLLDCSHSAVGRLLRNDADLNRKVA